MVTRFVILGCGYTGTSLLSGIFHVSGFGSIEEDGLFEPKPLVELNELALKNGFDQQLMHDYKRFFARLEEETNGRWCIKDPRLSLTVHHLYDILPRPVKFLFNIRDPRNTVSHLLRVKLTVFPSMDRAEAVRGAEKEWYERNVSILEFVKKHPEVEYLVVNYDDLVENTLKDVINGFVGKRMNYRLVDPGRRKSPPMEVDQKLAALHEDILVLYRRKLKESTENTISIKRGLLEPLREKIEYRRYLDRKHLGQSRVRYAVGRILAKTKKVMGLR